jgi:hypothetical protein
MWSVLDCHAGSACNEERHLSPICAIVSFFHPMASLNCPTGISCEQTIGLSNIVANGFVGSAFRRDALRHDGGKASPLKGLPTTARHFERFS